MKKQALICNNHNNILSLARDLERLHSYDYEKIEDFVDYVNNVASEIIHEANQALESGQNMEYRLDEYYQAIVNLGFSRR